MRLLVSQIQAHLYFCAKGTKHRSIPDVKYESGDLGELLKRVLRFYTLRGKFEGIYDAQSCDED